MNTRLRILPGNVFRLVTLTCLSLTLESCIDLTGGRTAWEAERRARAPYYGTGVVTSVIGTGLVDLTFKSPPPPATMATLIIVRSNSVVAKVEFGVGQFDSKHLCKVLEGSPKVGDLALGWQREAEFTPPSPWRKLP